MKKANTEEKNTEGKITKEKKKLPLFYKISAGILILIVAFFSIYLLPGNYVPFVLGADSRKPLHDGSRVIIDKKQNPFQGDASIGSTVIYGSDHLFSSGITVSESESPRDLPDTKSTENITVPNVVGKDLKSAAIILSNCGLSLTVSWTADYLPDSDVCYVKAQSIPEKAVVQSGTSVNLDLTYVKP